MSLTGELAGGGTYGLDAGVDDTAGIVEGPVGADVGYWAYVRVDVAVEVSVLVCV